MSRLPSVTYNSCQKSWHAARVTPPQTATRLPDNPTQPGSRARRSKPNQTKPKPKPTKLRLMANHTQELSDAQLETISGGFLDATLGSSVLGDGMLCIGGGLINSKMELNL